MPQITITRTFDSTEEAIAFLSGASPRAQATAAASTAVETAKAVKPKAEKPAAPTAPVSPLVEQAEPRKTAAAAAAASAPKADAVDYPSLQKAVFKLAGIAGTGRDAATALLAQFGVKTFKDLDSSKWAEALAAVTAKIDELTVAA